MNDQPRRRCQVTTDGKSFCAMPATIRVVAIDSVTRREHRGTATYTCIQHAVPLLQASIDRHMIPNATWQLIEMPGADGQIAEEQIRQSRRD